MSLCREELPEEWQGVKGKSRGLHTGRHKTVDNKNPVYMAGVLASRRLSFFALVCCPKLNAYGAAAVPINETLATSALSNTLAV